MNSKKLTIVAAAGALLLTGCSKKLNQFQADYFPLIPIRSKWWAIAFPLR